MTHRCHKKTDGELFQEFKKGKYFTQIEVIRISTARLLQSCPTLCDPIDGSPPRSPVPGILQARTLEWGAISFSNAWKWKVKGKSLSRVRLLATPWTTAHQAPPSMGFSRQEYWSGVPLPSPNGGYNLGRPWSISRIYKAEEYSSVVEQDCVAE